jgi:hypothetical protein
VIDHYDWPGGREAMLRFGPADGPVVVVAMPLFEEANRTRAFVVTILRALAERGIASALPDLPGTGESLVPLEECDIIRIAEGIQYASEFFQDQGRPVYGVAIRSGALLDKWALQKARWSLAPQTGAELVDELKRIKQASLGSARKLDEFWWFDPDLADGEPNPPVEIAGNLIPADLINILTAYQIWPNGDDFPVRTVRLESDPKAADLKVSGAPLWRRTEPDNDPALAALLADDIAAWVRACEG